MSRMKLYRALATTILLVVVNDRSQAADPTAVLSGKGLRPSGSVFALKAEDDVIKAVAAAGAAMKNFRLEKEANLSEAEKKDLAAELSVQRNEFRQQMNMALPQIQEQIRQLTMQQAALNQQQSGGQYGGSAGGILQMSNSQNTSYQMNALTQQIAQLQMQSEQMNSEFNEFNNQINQLTPRNMADSRKAKAGAKPSVSAIAKARKALEDSLLAARKVVDETKKSYADLSVDSQVKAALDTLNRTTSLKPSLGPTPKMLQAVKSLERAETFLAHADDPAGATKSTASLKRKGRSAKKK